MKNTVEEIPIFYLLSVRFFTGAAVLLVISHKKLSLLNPDIL
jgi:hypothetical protein